jgi:hypothetical protein
MFLSLTTKRKEKICINSSHIVSLTPLRNGGTLVQLCDGFELEVVENMDILLDFLKPIYQSTLI